MSACAAVVGRDLRLALRRPVDTLAVLFFFALAAALFPLGLGPDPSLLARIAPGVLWVAALLAAMLSLDRMFLGDFEDGSLELLAAAPFPLPMSVLAKVSAHWLTTGLPLLAAAPAIGVMLRLEPDGHGVLLAAMALGTAAVSFVGALGAALVLGARRSGVLLSLLTLPLLVPVLVFGTAAVDAAAGGRAAGPHLMLLGALLLGAAALCPWAAAAALRIAVE